MENVFIRLFCTDIVICSSVCRTWADCIKTNVRWRDYCFHVGMPIPLSSFTAWAKYSAQLVFIRRCWFNYNVLVLQTINASTDRIVFNGPDEPLPDYVRLELSHYASIFGTLPSDYVASLSSSWQEESFALGDVTLVRSGTPIIRDACQSKLTGVCALSIGYIAPNGFGGHALGIDYDVHEIVLSFRVNEDKEAWFVRYTVVCHGDTNDIEGSPAVWYRRSAAALITEQGDSLHTQKKNSEGFPEIYMEVYNSYALMILSCTDQILSGATRPCPGCNFNPCFTPCFMKWHGLEDPFEKPEETNENVLYKNKFLCSSCASQLDACVNLVLPHNPYVDTC